MSRRFSRFALAGLAIALAGCGGADSGLLPSDIGSIDAWVRDVPVLNDAVVLEVAAGDPAPRETLEPPDAPAGEDAPPADTFGVDDGKVPDDAVDDSIFLPDPAGPFDAIPADPASPDEGGPASFCGDHALPCEDGSICVTDSNGASHCAPIEECSGKGALDLEELARLLVAGEGQVRVKVLAMAWPGKPACSPLPCPPDHPCCNTCFAPMFIGAETFPIVLNGHGATIGCQGSECDVLEGCRPFALSSWYWVWGMAGIVGGKAQLTVDGFCPADVGAGS